MNCAIVSKNVAYGVRPQVPPRMEHQVPEAGARRQSSLPRQGTDTGNMRNAQYPDRERARIEGPHPSFHIDAAADLGIKNSPVSEGQNITKDTARICSPAAAVLGATRVEQGLLCRKLRHHHRRDDYGIHTKPR